MPVNRLAIPKPVSQKLSELNELVNKYPTYIPVATVAQFLEIAPTSLRCSIERGQCPFGLGWQIDRYTSRGYKIPTVPFYLWYTQGVGGRGEK